MIGELPSWHSCFYSCLFLQSVSQHSGQKDHVKPQVRSRPSSVQKLPVAPRVTQTASKVHTMTYKDLHGLYTSALLPLCCYLLLWCLDG